MKKLLLSLGAVAAIVTPVVTVISCGGSKDKNTDESKLLKQKSLDVKQIGDLNISDADKLALIAKVNDSKTRDDLKLIENTFNANKDETSQIDNKGNDGDNPTVANPSEVNNDPQLANDIAAQVAKLDAITIEPKAAHIDEVAEPILSYPLAYTKPSSFASVAEVIKEIAKKQAIANQAKAYNDEYAKAVIAHPTQEAPQALQVHQVETVAKDSIGNSKYTLELINHNDAIKALAVKDAVYANNLVIDKNNPRSRTGSISLTFTATKAGALNNVQISANEVVTLLLDMNGSSANFKINNSNMVTDVAGDPDGVHQVLGWPLQEDSQTKNGMATLADFKALYTDRLGNLNDNDEKNADTKQIDGAKNLNELMVLMEPIIMKVNGAISKQGGSDMKLFITPVGAIINLFDR